MTQPSAALSGTLFALVSATLYGANIAYARLASFAGVSGPTLVFYRVFIMLALVGVAALALRRTLALPREERGVMLVTGIATAGVGLFYLSSVAFIPVTVAVVVFYTFPILIVLASPFVEGTRLTAPILGIAALALTGVVLVVGPAFHGLDWRGLALAMAASVATATQFFAAARFRRTGVFAKVFWIHLLILPVTFVIGLATTSLHGPENLTLAPLAVAMTVGGYVFGFVLQFLALARISALVAGIVYCLEPVIAALTSTLVLGEGLAGIQFVGGALVLAAILLNVVLDQPRAAVTRAAETVPETTP
jgi:drug/metabolite transporter (DMT)-like permease